MNKTVKIINNLYLGSMYSHPKKYDIEIIVAKEPFDQNNKYNKKSYYWIKNKLFCNFSDYPTSMKSIDSKLVDFCIDTINKNIENKVIYIHCIWGTNRSASIVFIYLVKNNILNNQNLTKALEQYKKIYPVYAMNPGWKQYIAHNYPFKKK